MLAAFAVQFALVEEEDRGSDDEVDREAEGLGGAGDNVEGEADHEGGEEVADILESVEEAFDVGGVFLEFCLFGGNLIEIGRYIFLAFLVVILPGSLIFLDGVQLFLD